MTISRDLRGLTVLKPERGGRPRKDPEPTPAPMEPIDLDVVETPRGSQPAPELEGHQDADEGKVILPVEIVEVGPRNPSWPTRLDLAMRDLDRAIGTLDGIAGEDHEPDELILRRLRERIRAWIGDLNEIDLALDGDGEQAET
jgi:hypothetical protein